MDDRCRHEMASHSQKQSMFSNGEKRSVRFGDDPRSALSSQRQPMKEIEVMEHDSEEPDDSPDRAPSTEQKAMHIEEEEEEFSQSEYDPRLEQKIEQIKNNYAKDSHRHQTSGGDLTKDNTT